jgi:hypothetical protein
VLLWQSQSAWWQWQDREKLVKNIIALIILCTTAVFSQTDDYGRRFVGPVPASVNAQTGTTYTLQASDNGKVVTFDNAAAITLTVPGRAWRGVQLSHCATWHRASNADRQQHDDSYSGNLLRRQQGNTQSQRSSHPWPTRLSCRGISSETDAAHFLCAPDTGWHHRGANHAACILRIADGA